MFSDASKAKLIKGVVKMNYEGCTGITPAVGTGY